MANCTLPYVTKIGEKEYIGFKCPFALAKEGDKIRWRETDNCNGKENAKSHKLGSWILFVDLDSPNKIG